MNILLLGENKDYEMALVKLNLPFIKILESEAWIEAMYSGNYTHVILCTEARKHLAQIWVCLANNLPVLCHYPLCPKERKEFAKKLPVNADIMLGHPLLYNKSVAHIKDIMQRDNHHDVSMLSERAAKWSIDNLEAEVKHDLAVIDYCYGGIININPYHYYTDDTVQCINVTGTTNQGNFYLNERVYDENEFMTALKSINSYDIAEDDQMYNQMLLAFIEHRYTFDPIKI